MRKDRESAKGLLPLMEARPWADGKTFTYRYHQIGARHYVRYVDDFIILHESPQWLHQALTRITAWLPERLGAHLNPTKTILQPVDRGIDFVGHVIKPWRRTTRKRTVMTQPLGRSSSVG